MYSSESVSTPIPLGPAKLAFPYTQDKDLITREITQPYVIRASDYSPPPLNTTYTGQALLHTQPSGTFYYVGDSEPFEVGCGMVEFDRTWTNIPQSTFKALTSIETFPGFVNIRNPFSEQVASKEEVDFYLVGSGTAYPDETSIPIIQENKVEYFGGQTQPLLGNVYLANEGFGGWIYYYASSPSISGYQSWIANDINPTGYSIVAEPSRIEQVKGNLYRRVTRKVKAK